MLLYCCNLRICLNLLYKTYLHIQVQGYMIYSRIFLKLKAVLILTDCAY